MEAIEYIRKVKCVSAKDSVTELKLDMQQVVRLMEGYHRELVKNNVDLANVSKSFTAEQVVDELEDCETLDDAIMFFKEKMQQYIFANGLAMIMQL